jgi:NADH:ubiquinone oxidoreductase subunit B-like Fe-S oxidoreductase
MPQPKFVVAIGACACSGGVFQGTYGTLGGVDKVLPVNAYIPGCPPRPEAIIDGVVKLLNALAASAAPKKAPKEPPKEVPVEVATEVTVEVKPDVKQ